LCATKTFARKGRGGGVLGADRGLAMKCPNMLPVKLSMANEPPIANLQPPTPESGSLTQTDSEAATCLCI